MMENIFHQKQWKKFSIKNDGKYFPVENVFRKADEFSQNLNVARFARNVECEFLGNF